MLSTVVSAQRESMNIVGEKGKEGKEMWRCAHKEARDWPSFGLPYETRIAEMNLPLQDMVRTMGTLAQ
jgi:hypothetical protein